MDRWPEYNPTGVMRESTKSVDEYVKKLENRISSLDHQLKGAKEDAERMQDQRDVAVKELSIITEKCAKLEENQAVKRSIQASRELHNAFEAAEFVLREVRNLGSVSVRENGQSKDLNIQALQEDLQEVLEHNGVITSQLRDAQEENGKLRGVIANLQTDLEILQSVNIRFRNIFRDFSEQAQCNFKDTNQIIASINDSRPASNAGVTSVSHLSIQGSPDSIDGSQNDSFDFEGAANVSVDNGMNQACGPAEEEIFPEAFLEAISNITPEEMAALEKAFENV